MPPTLKKESKKGKKKKLTKSRGKPFETNLKNIGLKLKIS